jgi:small multidrug resistance pump
MKFVLIGVYIILTISGLILMKLGGNSGTISLNEGTIGFSINWISLIGFVCYICSFLLFTKIVIMFDLSYIMPICTGIVQIITLIASKIVFKETITIQGIIGASIVIVGIIIMNIPKTVAT